MELNRNQKVLASFVLLVVVGTLISLVVWNLRLPVVQIDSVTNEKVAVITADGTVHPPSYLEEAQLKYYSPEYVQTGYRPTRFGVKSWELKRSE